jgi:hypothetical protein
MNSTRLVLLLTLTLLTFQSLSQVSPLYKNLPVGKYPVGFKIITIDDPTRVVKSDRNYLGEENKGDRARKITIHLWYPAKSASGRLLTYGDYCYNVLQKSTDEAVTTDQKESQIRARRNSVENWFGKVVDATWQELIRSPMLGHVDAPAHNEKFPLLIGMLRSLSTSMTNEVMASNGYVVAMVNPGGSASFSDAALADIPDMQMALHYLETNLLVEPGNTGVYGFSGSGFTPVLFGMYDVRVKALADIESGIYMEGLYQGISESNYYNPAKLKIPFLHIFSRDLSQQEKYLADFERRTKFSSRYRLVLNQPKLHHWDFACEGYTASLMLNNRGAEKVNIQRAFEIATHYLINFFNATLKNDQQAISFLSNKPVIKDVAPDAWDIFSYPKTTPAPDIEEFEYLIQRQGISAATKLVSERIRQDSSSNIWQGFAINRLGYTFLNDKKFNEAIGVFVLNTELHPDEANFFDSLTEAYELSGDKTNMKKSAARVLEILNSKTVLSDSEKALKENAELRMKR